MEYKVENNSECDDDVLIIDCSDDIPKPSASKRKIPTTKTGRIVSLDKIDNNTETLIITQKVEVNRRKIKYVINLNTNISDANKKSAKDPPKVLNSNIERFVPKCSRPKCQAAIKLKKRSQIDTINKKYSNRISKHRTKNQKANSKRNERHCCKHSTIKKSNHSNKQRTCKEQNVNIDDSLSSISLSPLRNNEVSYEDISTDSFICSDNDLDKLIKRTKERDKLSSQGSGYFSQPVDRSTPLAVIEISSDSETEIIDEDKKNMFCNPTCNLEPQVDILLYSPTKSLCSKAVNLENFKKKSFPLNNATISHVEVKDVLPCYSNNNLLNNNTNEYTKGNIVNKS